ncbi:hypothetical protein [Halalkalicoccus sp. NIPERK01]|uniref:hypothetical protein n=1 Tax=Halalkalicoccus sp. NIPERK01 TaxID=3053469 RepID=UPI00256F53FD|nr:hypothetical protein [Halalkalicoccus sp. NIPERK01]MDL5363285.1 hypothetical protein [Halalkalicoccus sp. NIPERK01]
MEQNTFRCRDCEWPSRGGFGASRYEATKRAISHHVETGHEIVSTARAETDPAEPAPRVESRSPPATRPVD